MSTLLLISFWEFKQFLQIVLWIAIPGTIISILITTILHYRRKKSMREAGPELAGPGQFILSVNQSPLPDWLTSSNPENTSLLKKYEREIRRYKENYSILEQDFRALEEKYGDLLNKAYHNDQSGNEAVDRLQQEIKNYKLKIAQLQQALEFNAHNQPIAINTGFDPMEVHQLRIEIGKLQEENSLMKERLGEQQYMQDLLEEKKLQTDFLQQQLEQRIKNYHLLEKQAGLGSAELEALRSQSENFNAKEQAFLEELRQKQEEVMALQHTINGSQEKTRQQQEAFHEKLANMEKLESDLLALQREQAALQMVIVDRQEAIVELESIIYREQQKARELENKLEMSSQLFTRIYSELATSLQAGLAPMQNGNGPVPQPAAN